MQFDWSPEFRERLDAARGFAETVLAPQGRVSGLDRSGWRQAAQFGLLRTLLPADFGSKRPGGALASAALFEALGRGGADRGLLFAMGAHLFGCLAPLLIHGTPEQAAAWEEKLRDGSAIAALAVSEAVGGSSFEHIACEATPVEGGYRLTGGKTLVSNAPAADLFVVLARLVGRTGALGLTAFLMPAESEGVSVAPIAAAGLPGAPMGSVEFDGCWAPAAAVLGRPGAGLLVFATAMQWERSCLLAGFLGAAERDLAFCRDFLASRYDAGGPLLRHQALSHRLARMKLLLESARLMLYRAAWLVDQGRDDHAAAAMAKLAASEAVVTAAEDTFRVLAGAGWRGEAGNPVAALTDALGTLLASGTSEALLELVARELPSDGQAR